MRITRRPWILELQLRSQVPDELEVLLARRNSARRMHDVLPNPIELFQPLQQQPPIRGQSPNLRLKQAPVDFHDPSQVEKVGVAVRLKRTGILLATVLALGTAPGSVDS